MVGGALVIGLPILFFFLRNGPDAQLSAVYSSLFDPRQMTTGWMIVLAPYAIVQLVRSIVWAVKTVRK